MAASQRVLAVVTVNYNSSGVIGNLLAALSEAQVAVLGIWVVDNNSPDSIEARAAAESAGANFLALDRNHGYGGAVNRGVSILPAEVDTVLIANPDTLIDAEAVAEMTRVLDAETAAAAVGPRILNVDGSTYPSARNQPSLKTGLGHALFSGFWPGNPWSRNYRQDAESGPSQRSVGWLSGACLLVDRTRFEQVGGFDERFFMYFEDVELGRRFLHAGFHNIYAPSASITHIGAYSTRRDSAKMIQAHHRSAYEFLANRYKGPWFIPLRLGLSLALRVRAWWVTRALRSS